MSNMIVDKRSLEVLEIAQAEGVSKEKEQHILGEEIGITKFFEGGF